MTNRERGLVAGKVRHDRNLVVGDHEVVADRDGIESLTIRALADSLAHRESERAKD